MGMPVKEASQNACFDMQHGNGAYRFNHTPVSDWVAWGRLIQSNRLPAPSGRLAINAVSILNSRQEKIRVLFNSAFQFCTLE
jgi:hypothetical protein